MIDKLIDSLVFREYTEGDESDLLALNQSVVELTSPLDSKRLALLRSQGCRMTVVETAGAVAGIVMCFTGGSRYDSINYQWFDQRVKSFLYIDRIIVSQACRGMGVGQRIYRHLKHEAALAGRHWLAAEINSQPPNIESLAFHRKQGFIEAGSQSLGTKTVSMQLYSLSPCRS